MPAIQFGRISKTNEGVSQMAIFTQPEATGGSFNLFKDVIKDDVCPPGQYAARCIDIKEEYGVKVQKFQSEETELQDRIAFLFECVDEDGKSLIATRPMKISGHEKSALFAFLKGWLGKAPAYGMDTDTLKGHPALLTVVEKKSNSGKVYTVLDAVVPLPKAMKAMLDAAPATAKAEEEESADVPF